MPGGQIIFCDDIRNEMFGKLSLMGVYPNELVFHGEPPAALPQLCALVNYHFDPQNLPKTLVARLTFEQDSGEEQVLVETVDELPEFQGTVSIQLPPTTEPHAQAYVRINRVVRLDRPTFPGPGRLKVRMHIGDDEVRIGSLRISFAPPAKDQDGAGATSPA
jgi:hypothetical protein